MAGGSTWRIYWANSMFTEADRNFNVQCAEALRSAGYQVFLPQEAIVNHLFGEASPSAQDIFRVDTSAILDSHLLVACIDQETIDSGVACEIGIAFAHGIPIIGLYTDIRQHRKGCGQMYKNPYVVGAIESAGEVVSCIGGLLHAIQRYLTSSEIARSTPESEKPNLRHFNVVAPRYSGFVARLESWYEPLWNVKQIVDRWFQIISPKRVIEFGCGSGDLGAYVSHQYPEILYIGYDGAEKMVQFAKAQHNDPGCVFTASWSEVVTQSDGEPFDIALVPFTLHDHMDQQKTISQLARCLRPDGIMLVIDLSTWDLPKVTNMLRSKLGRPLRVPDRRLDPAKLTRFAQASGCAIIDCGIALPLVHFPSAHDLNGYLEVFGIYEGMDLPLGLGDGKMSAVQYHLIEQVLENQNYPFTDQRAFITCALKKR